MTFDPRMDERLRGYLDGSLPAVEREAFEEQASRDPDLRQRLIELRREQAPAWTDLPVEVRERALALGEQQARTLGQGRAWRRAAVAAAVAATLGAGLWWALRPPADGSDGEVLRSSRATSTGSVELLAPAADERLTDTTAHLEWTGPPAARGYTLFLLDVRGEILSRAEVEGPRHRLDMAAELAAGRPELCWYVVAELPDGSTVPSEPRCFRLPSAEAP